MANPTEEPGSSIVHAQRNPQISQSIFRFVSHTSATGTYSSNNSFPGHKVVHPNPPLSTFLVAAGSGSPTAIEDAISSFASYNGVSGVKEENTALYGFSTWLRQNRTWLPYTETSEAATGIIALTEEQLIRLWDNLFYQALTDQSPQTRDSILQVLQTNSWLNVFQAFDEAAYTAEVQYVMEKQVTAPVIIPGVLFQNDIETLAYSTISTIGHGILTERLASEIVITDIQDLRNALAEIHEAGQTFANTYRTEYDIAFENYLVEAATALGSSRPAEPFQEGEYPIVPIEVPNLIFNAPDPFDEAFLNAQLSPRAKSVFDKIKLSSHTTITDIEVALLDKIEKMEAEGFSPLPSVREISLNGAKVVSDPYPQTDRIVIKAHNNITDGSSSIFVSVFQSTEDINITKATIELSIGAELQTASATKAAFSSAKTTTFHFFADGVSLEGDPGTFNASIIILNDRGEEKRSSTPDGWSPETMYMGTWDPEAKGEETTSTPGTWAAPLYGVKEIGVADFHRVEQELCCYVEGEVSHIENVLAREYKERSTRSLTRSETTTEERTDREVEKLTDTTSTDRYELQSEVSQVLEESKQRDWGSSASVSYSDGVFDASLSGTLNGSNSSANSTSFNQAESFAKEVTERALERMIQRVSKTRTSRVLREFEENNRHGFDNRKGDKHVVGIYRWVDKLYKNKLINYGKRLVYEFKIPEPARNFVHLMTKNQNSASTVGTPPVPPVNPANLSPALTSASVLTRGNYSRFAKEYGAEVEAPPVEIVRKAESFHETMVGTENTSDPRVGVKSFNMELPDGYYCQEVRFNAGLERYGSHKNDTYRYSSAHFSISTYKGILNEGAIEAAGWVPIWACEEKLPISFNSADASVFRINVVTQCRLKGQVYDLWKAQAYLAIMEAYQERVREYEDAKAQYDAEQAQQTSQSSTVDFNFNPLFNRSVEKRELKRLAIEMVTKPYGKTMGQDHYGSTNCGFQVMQNSALDHHAKLVGFLEEAFDWEIMAYTLFPYYWAKSCDWGNLMSTTSNSDFIFQAFLQSGMAQLKVPVKPGYEKAVMFYLDTGTIWSKDSNITLDELEELYDEIDDLLEIGNADPIAEWSSRVPTALTIVQTNSGPLDANGLPCMNDSIAKVEFCEDGTPIGTGTNVLNGPTPRTCDEIEAERVSLMDGITLQLDLYAAQGPAVCTSVKDTLARLMIDLEALYQEAIDQECDTTQLEADISFLQSEIVRITNECN